LLVLSITRVTVAQTSIVGDAILPICEKSEGRKLLGRGKFGLNFSVPKHGFNVHGGRPDVDYVLYVVSPKKSKTVLQLWFGGMTLPLSPSSQKLDFSTNLKKTEFTVDSGRLKGGDFRGRSTDGSYWRHFAIEYQGGAVYDTKDKQDADRLDDVVDSACYTPYPAGDRRPQ
jgi:hypothetical protein